MSLRSRRNLPIVLLLVGILSALALTMGNQPIVSYTVHVSPVQATRIVQDLEEGTGWLANGIADTNVLRGASAFVSLP